jgi:hypothetical protein
MGSTMRMLHGFALGLLLIGCGGSTATGSSRQFDDARITPTGSGGASDASSGGTGGTSTDAGTFACGPNRCSANEICVHPDCGCIVVRVARNDAGSCPTGYKLDDAGTCYAPLTCRRPGPYCVRPGGDGGLYSCTGANGTLQGTTSGPVPIGSSRICYEWCV